MVYYINVCSVEVCFEFVYLMDTMFSHYIRKIWELCAKCQVRQNTKYIDIFAKIKMQPGIL